VSTRAWRRSGLWLVLLFAGSATAAGVHEVRPRPGATLHIDLASADLLLEGVDGPAIRVSPLSAGDAADLALLSLATASNGDVRLTLAEGAPSSRRRGRWRVEAPRTLPIDARIVRGSIVARGLRGRTRLNVETGDITAHGVRLTDGHSLKCRTFNGDVTIDLAAAPVDARILALTLNGAVKSALPLTTRAAFGPRFGETTIGSGEHVLSIDVVRGDITIALGRD
jgi:hypothetical protein